MPRIFYRNVRARDQLEVFLLSAVSSLLLVRFYLYVTGYPQLGSGGLHIAHMLWGGLLMLASIVLALSFMGARVQRIVAALGGIGFGVFIDELGKFITRDNDYFFQPTVGIIYMLFVVLYLTFNFMSRRSVYTSREYQLNALAQLEEAIVYDMDPLEKERVKKILAAADQSDPITRILERMLQRLPTIPPAKPNKVARLRLQIEERYRTWWQGRDNSTAIRLFFLVEVSLFVLASWWSVIQSIDHVFEVLNGHVPFFVQLAIGQLVASLVAASFAVWGIVVLPRSHLAAYEQFRRATLINIFLTQAFMFLRVEFEALPGFLFNLLLLGCIGYAIRQRQKPPIGIPGAAERPKK
jgi:Ca2+/Na+ antiporter